MTCSTAENEIDKIADINSDENMTTSNASDNIISNEKENIKTPIKKFALFDNSKNNDKLIDHSIDANNLLELSFDDNEIEADYGEISTVKSPNLRNSNDLVTIKNNLNLMFTYYIF
jgi:hypothetical protein